MPDKPSGFLRLEEVRTALVVWPMEQDGSSDFESNKASQALLIFCIFLMQVVDGSA